MFNTPELRFQVDEPRKFAAIEEVRTRLSGTGADVDATDGVRVSNADGWWLLRASNTQDVLVARAEAKANEASPGWSRRSTSSSSFPGSSAASRPGH